MENIEQSARYIKIQLSGTSINWVVKSNYMFVLFKNLIRNSVHFTLFDSTKQ